MLVLNLKLIELGSNKLYYITEYFQHRKNNKSINMGNELNKIIRKKEKELSTHLLIVEADIKEIKKSFENSIPEQMEEIEGLWKQQHKEREQRKDARKTNK